MRLRPWVGIMMLATAGCVAINVYLNFPALEKALDKWESEVRQEGLPPAPGPQKMAGDEYFEMQGGPDVNLETPALRKIKESRSKRFTEIARLMDKGATAEGYGCLLIPRDEVMGALSAKEKKEAQKHIREENEDRERLIHEIMKANNISGDGADQQVRERYFAVLRRQARVGWYVEFEPGKIRQKTAEDKKKD